MKVVHLSTWDYGGAAKACIRLHEALLQQGIDSALLTLSKSTGEVPGHFQYQEALQPGASSLPERVWRRVSGRAGRELREKTRLKAQRKQLVETVRQHFEHFSFPDSRFRHLADHPLIRQADVVNLHWVSDFLDYPSFWERLPGKKMVWTLHDMNAFTGGCHYSAGCNGFQADCRSCPQIRYTEMPDQAEKGLVLKKQVFAKGNELRAVVTPSRWLGACSSASSLFGHLPHYTIPYSLPTDLFRPLPQAACRQVLSLPEDKTILLFVSSRLGNKRKGFDILLESLKLLPGMQDVVVCSVGEAETGVDFSGVKHIALGSVQDEKLMSIVYNAANGFVIPSREDNLPNVVLESLACGTPVIGFAVGGITDMVEPGRNGLLAGHPDAARLAAAIGSFLNRISDFDRKTIAENTQARYSPDVQARAYYALYQKLLAG